MYTHPHSTPVWFVFGVLSSIFHRINISVFFKHNLGEMSWHSVDTKHDEPKHTKFYIQTFSKEVSLQIHFKLEKVKWMHSPTKCRICNEKKSLHTACINRMLMTLLSDTKRIVRCHFFWLKRNIKIWWNKKYGKLQRM